MNLEERIFTGLNPEQEAAVRTIDGPVLVFAGAGTGKTRVITHRIAYMIYQGIKPYNIAAMTFTNKAANEMRERLFNLVGERHAKELFIGTFHAFCSRMLRREISVYGLTKDFTIADDSDQIAIAKQAIAETGYKDELNPTMCLSVISRYKSKLKSPEDLRFEQSDNPALAKIADVYEKYNSILFLQNMLDFDDLLLYAVKLLQDFPEKLEFYRQKYTHILVDEYQDTNSVQLRLVELLAGDTMNVCVVGDDDQSIYGWRGADVRNILNFPNCFENVKLFKLEQNYRSTRIILDAANAVIAQNHNRHSKSLWSDCGEGEEILFVTAEDEEGEAYFVAENIENIKAAREGISYNDIAILYRSNYQSRNIEEALREMQIPYRIVGGRSFYERKEVRDAVAYLRLIVNPRDDQSFARIIASPPRGIGEKAVEVMRNEKNKCGKSFCQIIEDPEHLAILSSQAAKSAEKMGSALKKWRAEFANAGNLAQKAECFLSEIGYIDGLMTMYKDRDEALKRQENVFELINAMAAFENNNPDTELMLGDFLEKFALLDDSDKVEEESERKPAVTLMTVHSAKGLEFDCVFIVGLEHGIFPHERSLEEGSEEEERRLFYVALTRAKKKLFLSMANFRLRHGQVSIQRPSEFIADIPEKLIRFEHYKRRGSRSSLARKKNIAIQHSGQRRQKFNPTISFDD